MRDKTRIDFKLQPYWVMFFGRASQDENRSTIHQSIWTQPDRLINTPCLIGNPLRIEDDIDRSIIAIDNLMGNVARSIVIIINSCKCRLRQK